MSAIFISSRMAWRSMLSLLTGLDMCTELSLLFALLLILFYEVINGFHDTANAIATVIYTRAMQSQLAVFIAAVFNFFGVLLGGFSVAYAVMHILSTDLLLNISSRHGLAMVFSLLLSAIIWNLGTWYFSLPASSSHTLIGAIIGIGLTNSFMTGTPIVNSLNLPNILDIFYSLILSPIVGLVVAGSFMFFFQRYWGWINKETRMHFTPVEREKQDDKKRPPFWTRIALVLSSMGVAFSHGANDGQKGIGLAMLILTSIVPTSFAVNLNASDYAITRTRDAIKNIDAYFQQHCSLLKKAVGVKRLIYLQEIKKTKKIDAFHCYSVNTISAIECVKEILGDIKNYSNLSVEQRGQIRYIILCIADVTDKVAKLSEISSDEKRLLKNLKDDMLETIEYAPIWVVISVALALGVGTMVGWKRVTTTIGEKIGKSNMTYAQGISAQVTVAISIGVASYMGAPVSTTHVLSSSVAGTMIIDGGGLQRKTVTRILMSWILTFPASIILSNGLYQLSLLIIR